jgi:hypothetical protein
VICMLPLLYSPNYSIFFILQYFCEIIVTLPSIQLPYLIAPSSLSLSLSLSLIMQSQCQSLKFLTFLIKRNLDYKNLQRSGHYK